MHVRANIPKGVETMKRMLLIGNGFDKAHGLPTGYNQFQQWLEEKDPDFIERMATYFPDVFDESLEWWNDFENNLDVIDAHDEIKRVVEENYPNFGSDDFHDGDYHAASVEIEEEMNRLYLDIQEKFVQWIESIDLNEAKRKFNLTGFDFFLSFNYIATLTQIYGIHPDKILYIHGHAKEGESLIIGHNANPDHYQPGIDEEIPEEPADLDPMELQQWYEEVSDDYITMSTRQAAQAVVDSFKKPTEEIMDANRIFFGTISNLDEISFYGFSFSPVDMPYVKKMARFTASNAEWKIYYFSETDYKRAKEVKASLSHHKFKILILPTSDFPSFDTIQPRIPGMD